ncbi:MAG: murein transglycosylase domain-containing protein [Pseudomonadota bacterium]
MPKAHVRRNLIAGLLTITVVLPLLTSCSLPPSRTVIDAAISGDAEAVARAILEEVVTENVPVDIRSLPEFVEGLEALLRQIWPEKEPEVASQRRYVKYSNAYEARAIVDFDEGWLQVETIASEDAITKLRVAIADTLLTTKDMRAEDIFSDASPPTDGEPFLYRQIVDADGEPIRWRWRAERFADHLIATVLKEQRVSTNSGRRVLRSVRISLVKGHQHLRQLEYAELVLASSARYGVRPSLIYAVIEVESAFNPYAVSAANAYGLMQIVPSTAGRDVYERIKKRSGQPTREQLFQPELNIDIGSAYLHLVDDTYLNGITNPSSRSFATVAAYNGGFSSVLRTFDSTPRSAVARINGMNPTEVYRTLVDRHPFAETRRYLEKVTAAEQGYR